MPKTHVEAHTFESNFTIDELDDSLTLLETRLPQRAATKPAMLGRSYGTLFGDACWAYSLDERPIALRFLGAAFDCASALFSAGVARQDFEFTLDGRRYVGPAGDATNANEALWLDSFFLGMSLGRTSQLDGHLAFSTERLREAQGVGDEFRYTLVDALKAFWTEDPAWVVLAERALAQSEVDALTIMPPKMAEPYRAVARALTPIAAGDQGAFDAALVDVLEAHKAYYGRGAPSRGCDSLLSLAACGVAGLGLRRGLEIGVTSGYMPEWVFEG